MYETFWLLLMGHFVGDFILQTSTIARYKNDQIKTLLLHCLLIFGAELMAIMFMWTVESVLLVLLLTSTHFCVDYIKSKLKQISFTKSGTYFLIDQFLHILFIYWIALIMPQGKTLIPVEIAIAIVAVILNSYFSDILFYLFSTQSGTRPYQRNYLDYFLRGLSIFPFLIHFIWGLGYFVIAFLILLRYKQHKKVVLHKFIFTLLINILFLIIWRRYQ